MIKTRYCASVGKMVEHRPFVVGFAAEPRMEEYARRKREQNNSI